MKKLPISLVAVSVSVVSAQSMADQKIDIKKANVNSEEIDYFVSAIQETDSYMSIQNHIESLVKTLAIDNEPIKASEQAILAMRDDDAERGSGGQGFNANSMCYSNCYNACHGSRSWR